MKYCLSPGVDQSELDQIEGENYEPRVTCTNSKYWLFKDPPKADKHDSSEKPLKCQDDDKGSKRWSWEAFNWTETIYGST